MSQLRYKFANLHSLCHNIVSYVYFSEESDKRPISINYFHCKFRVFKDGGEATVKYVNVVNVTKNMYL